MFCRNCGKDIVGTPKVCANCGSHPVNATSFCRYCGGITSDQDVMCQKCGSAVRTFTKAGKASGKAEQGWSTKTKRRLIVAAAIFVVVYAVLALPARIVLKPLQSALSGFVLSTIGYTSIPLQSISANPGNIPMVAYNDRAENVARFAVDQTQQLTINAKYTKNTSTGSGISKDVTNNCTFQSSDEQIAKVTSTGLVKGIALGTANIKVSYTAIPGSDDLFSASKGKLPITITIPVPVTVR